MTGRLLIVANRLPLAVGMEGGEVRVETTAGGLATGLRGPHEAGSGLWFGWPGALKGLRKAPRQRALELLRERRFVPIELSREEVAHYYNEFSNGVLWPVCHYLLDRMPLQTPDWQFYRRVNERFAEAVAEQYQPGDMVWVHDFHLMLVPALLRARLPEARIGFFLHIPFPSSEVFRVLPWRAELLRGLLGADLIGFHTLSYQRHFAASLLRVLGLEVEVDRLLVDGREVRLAALPMGIDSKHFAELGDDPGVIAEAATVRQQAGGARIVLSIDRLDYTKGIPRRLLAFERLLETWPAASRPVQLVQVAVTSRGEVAEYQAYKRHVDELVGRIHGRFGRPDYTPIRYMNRNFGARAVAAFYRAADVMLVTPLRDGLNLVAKEFLAARTDGDGVLMLSEFAGVAAELPEALHYNPYDVDGAAQTLAAALAMPETERRRRIAPMREHLLRADVHSWVRTFLGELAATEPALRAAEGEPAPALAAALARGPLLLFLDYDGTLVEFAPRPERAVPDAALLGLLRAVAAGHEVHVVSGRSAEFLDQWLGGLPLWLHAEHGLRSRGPGSPWSELPSGEPVWRSRALALLERIAAHIPGSFVESKAQSVAWHYRAVEPAFAATVAKEVRLHLLELLSNQSAAVVEGNRVLEIRPLGVHKGQIVQRVLADRPQAAAVVVGDDRTDEDMFTAVSPEAVTIKVGTGPTAARFRVAGPGAVRDLLRQLGGGTSASAES
ncbi:MAG: bifunctional alpha,alpha-trehalose-phosphate synthase (UDP-forming)/trehalose-phosphatase [Planctomycetes bacterium]|nr:bifunctional alpha,alpha-trehalose-phosphate synthase (UDP-forming)/trehalose-phosphatase [Planctomycetota bacterium]